MPDPPRPPARPIACPRCSHTRTLTVTPNTRLRCPECRAEYRAPRLHAHAEAPEPEAPAERDPIAPAASASLPATAPAGAAGPRVVDVAGVTIRPAPPPEPGREPIPEPDPEAEPEAAPEPVTPRRYSGRDRRPIRRAYLDH